MEKLVFVTSKRRTLFRDAPARSGSGSGGLVDGNRPLQSPYCEFLLSEVTLIPNPQIDRFSWASELRVEQDDEARFSFRIRNTDSQQPIAVTLVKISIAPTVDGDTRKVPANVDKLRARGLTFGPAYVVNSDIRQAGTDVEIAPIGEVILDCYMKMTSSNNSEDYPFKFKVDVSYKWCSVRVEYDESASVHGQLEIMPD